MAFPGHPHKLIMPSSVSQPFIQQSVISKIRELPLSGVVCSHHSEPLPWTSETSLRQETCPTTIFLYPHPLSFSSLVTLGLLGLSLGPSFSQLLSLKLSSLRFCPQPFPSQFCLPLLPPSFCYLFFCPLTHSREASESSRTLL